MWARSAWTPRAYADALALAALVIGQADVPVEVIDVGGGFPVSYPDVTPPPLAAYFAEIESAIVRLQLTGIELWAEPGRALVASGTSVVVQVQLRRGDALYVNDGVYGSLSDAGRAWFPLSRAPDTQPCRSGSWKPTTVPAVRADLRRGRPHGGAILAAGRRAGR